MQLTKIVVITALLLSTQLVAKERNYIEFRYGIYDGKVKSYTDTASDTTHSPSLTLGRYLSSDSSYRATISYDYFNWSDANANNISLGIQRVDNLQESLDIYYGVDVGVFSFKGDALKKGSSKPSLSLRVGLEYPLTQRVEATVGLRYIYTGNINIEESQYLYSKVDNMLGGEVGIRWGF